MTTGRLGGDSRAVTPEQRHLRAHSEARLKARAEGVYVYCPGDPPASIGLLGLVYGPSGAVAALPPSGEGEADFLRLIELANNAIRGGLT